jgi:tetratricopeptide (TPR) repeat protein
MTKTPATNLAFVAFVLALLITVQGVQLSAEAQTPEDRANRERAIQLYLQNKFTEAIPLLEKLVKVYPNDPVIWEELGWATFVVSESLTDEQKRTSGRDHARAALLRAQELGDNSNLLRAGLEALSAPTALSASFSANKDANAAMLEGETAHVRGEFDKAIAAYERALKLDPTLYIAALWIGDMYFKKGYQETDTNVRDGSLNKAGEWFARAIAINENLETAHRYWGDALVLQGRPKEAMAKFIDGIIAEPGNRNAYAGLSQWGDRYRVEMGHPAIEVPTKVTLTSDKKLNVEFDPRLRSSEDGSAAWENYGAVRTRWFDVDFSKRFPNEHVYRHTLSEETEALRKTAEAAAALLKTGKVKSLSPSLAALVRLNEADLLEPFIFFARVDEGISQDYPEFRRAHRDKLRRYWSDVVIARQ